MAPTIAALFGLAKIGSHPTSPRGRAAAPGNKKFVRRRQAWGHGLLLHTHTLSRALVATAASWAVGARGPLRKLCVRSSLAPVILPPERTHRAGLLSARAARVPRQRPKPPRSPWDVPSSLRCAFSLLKYRRASNRSAATVSAKALPNGFLTSCSCGRAGLGRVALAQGHATRQELAHALFTRP
jgi:hypothetical protein